MSALSIIPGKIARINLKKLKKSKTKQNKKTTKPMQFKATFKANVVDVDSIQIIHIETTLTKQVMWLVSGLCGFTNF